MKVVIFFYYVSASGDGEEEFLSESDEEEDVDSVWSNHSAGPKDISFTGENKIKLCFPSSAKHIDYFIKLVNVVFFRKYSAQYK